MTGFCAICKRRVRVAFARGGDGTMVVPFRHKNAAGQPCEGWMHEAQETP
jgi:hypothetical protein